jgi:hypothetical protein
MRSSGTPLGPGAATKDGSLAEGRFTGSPTTPSGTIVGEGLTIAPFAGWDVARVDAVPIPSAGEGVPGTSS